MNKWIYMLSAIVWITQVLPANAANKIAIVNVSSVFQNSSQRAKVIKQLEHEFKERANDLENMENELQLQMQTLQRDGNTMKTEERNKLEKSLISQREIFTNKAKEFQKDNHSRQTEERDKILNTIHNLVTNIAKQENYDIVIDSNAVVYNNSYIADITNSVMKKIG
ncbi:OmpH family outer membrane protein [Candidatus Blochmannia ocreatus (nom. nud.)]|uniref:Chaperone protein Skp n=1 Tax=Candidatus Blochmannia ocreatus (nom. nud.) TaxID=251538 RepID=A0ABY4SWK8_9ENTR|nr:OmpH family outer membrane protein [Candidatus Blochmannia ocreatus]URJ25345.1 OmpH family outer membrane protein [Candidatus Blochmannia ocreatus]